MAYYRYTPGDSFPPIIKNLIIINVLVFLAQMVLDSQVGLTSKLVLWPVQSPNFQPYQIATHMFAHASFGHIIFNMLGLYFFGRLLENVWGGKRFLFFYLACGVGATLYSLGVDYVRYDQVMRETAEALENNDMDTAVRIGRQLAPSLGASGAVMGVVAGFGYLFPSTKIMFFPLPVPVKAIWLVFGIIAIDLFSGVSNAGKDMIGHFAHLGGALTGIILIYIWNKTNRKTLY